MPGKPNDKWLATMLAKHGSREAVTAFMQANGRKGGKTNHGAPKGFAQDRELASAAGKKGGRVRGEQYKRSKLGSTWVKKKPNSASSNSTTKTSRKGTCLECGKSRVSYLGSGFCQRDYHRLGKLGRDLVHESQAINRGEKSNNYETVTVPGWDHLDDVPEFIIDRPMSLYERFFGWRHHR